MRDNRLDIFRILLICGVVCIHTFCVLDFEVYPHYRTLGLAANVICHYTVPMFAMLSGIVLMSKYRESLQDFYRKRIARLLVPLIPCVCFFVLLRLFRDGNSASVVIKETCLGTPYYHLWFAFMLLGVYVLIPFLSRLVHEIHNGFLIAGCVLLISVSNYVGEGPFQIMPFAGYTVIGMTLYRRYAGAQHKIEGVVAVAVGVLVTVVNMRLVLMSGCLRTIGYCTPYIMIGSMALLIVFVTFFPIFNVGRLVTWMAGLVYGVYLWHPIFKGASNFIISRLPEGVGRPWLVFPLTCLSAFAVIGILSRVHIFAVLLGVREVKK
jgi:surface polysaccharide O-acyltransferase-like enzyme